MKKMLMMFSLFSLIGLQYGCSNDKNREPASSQNQDDQSVIRHHDTGISGGQGSNR